RRFRAWAAFLLPATAMSRNKLLLCLLTAGVVGCNGTDNTGDDTAPPWYEGVSTLTGAAQKGNKDGVRGVARLNNPVNVAYGPDHKLYVADFDNDLIRVVDAETGDTSTLIKQPSFARPFGLAFGKDGTLWVSTDNNGSGSGHSLMTGSLWRINPGARAAT